MILEIALGIVLAYVIIALLPVIIGGSLVLGVVGTIVAIFLLVIFNIKTTAICIGFLIAIAVPCFIPYWINSQAEKKYPKWGALLKGQPPYDKLATQPFRLAVMACYVISGVFVMFGGWYGLLSLVSLSSQAIGK